jgi:hypothetical protein
MNRSGIGGAVDRAASGPSWNAVPSSPSTMRLPARSRRQPPHAASGATRNGRAGDCGGLEQAHALSGLMKDGATALEGETIPPERIVSPEEPDEAENAFAQAMTSSGMSLPPALGRYNWRQRAPQPWRELVAGVRDRLHPGKLSLSTAERHRSCDNTLNRDLPVSHHAPVSITPKRRKSHNDRGSSFGRPDWTASS